MKLSINNELTNANINAGCITLENTATDHFMQIGGASTNIGVSANGNICYSTASIDHKAQIQGTITGLNLDSTGRIVISTGTAANEPISVKGIRGSNQKRGGALQVGGAEPNVIFGGTTNAQSFDFNGLVYYEGFFNLPKEAVNMNDADIVKGGPWIGSYGNFDGVDDYLNLGQPPALDFGTSTDFTIGFYGSSATTGTSQVIVGKSSGADKNEFAVRVDGGISRFQLRTANSNFLLGTPNQIAPGVKYSVMCVMNRTTQSKLYVDGALDGTGTMATGTDFSFSTSAQDIEVGPSFAGRQKGWFDGIRIYNRALTAVEAKAIHDRVS